MNISKEEVISKIKNFIFKVLKMNIGDEEDIFAIASKNSLFAFQFILFLERTFEIEVTPEDFDAKVFSNVGALSEFILVKMREVYNFE